MLRQQCKQKTFFSFFLRSWWTPQAPKNVSAINLSSHAGFSFIFILMSPPPPHPPDDDDVVVVVPIMSLTIMNEYQYESIFISLASLVLLWSLTYFSLSLSLWWWWMMNDDMMDGYCMERCMLSLYVNAFIVRGGLCSWNHINLQGRILLLLQILSLFLC